MGKRGVRIALLHSVRHLVNTRATIASKVILYEWPSFRTKYYGKKVRT
jgi:hypothetical protein